MSVGRDEQGGIALEQRILEMLETDVESLDTLYQSLSLWPDEDVSHRTHVRPRSTKAEIWSAVQKLVACGRVEVLVWDGTAYMPTCVGPLNATTKEKYWFRLR